MARYLGRKLGPRAQHPGSTADATPTEADAEESRVDAGMVQSALRRHLSPRGLLSAAVADLGFCAQCVHPVLISKGHTYRAVALTRLFGCEGLLLRVRAVGIYLRARKAGQFWHVGT